MLLCSNILRSHNVLQNSFSDFLRKKKVFLIFFWFFFWFLIFCGLRTLFGIVVLADSLEISSHICCRLVCRSCVVSWCFLFHIWNCYRIFTWSHPVADWSEACNMLHQDLNEVNVRNVYVVWKGLFWTIRNHCCINKKTPWILPFEALMKGFNILWPVG